MGLLQPLGQRWPGLRLGVQNNGRFQLKVLSVIWRPCFEIHKWTKQTLEVRVHPTLQVHGPDLLQGRHRQLRVLWLLHRLLLLWLLHRLLLLLRMLRWLLILLLLRLAAAAA